MTIPTDATKRFKEGFGNLFSVDGKTAVVTGGSKGIDEMIAARSLFAFYRLFAVHYLFAIHFRRLPLGFV